MKHWSSDQRPKRQHGSPGNEAHSCHEALGAALLWLQLKQQPAARHSSQTVEQRAQIPGLHQQCKEGECHRQNREAPCWSLRDLQPVAPQPDAVKHDLPAHASRTFSRTPSLAGFPNCTSQMLPDSAWPRRSTMGARCGPAMALPPLSGAAAAAASAPPAAAMPAAAAPAFPPAVAPALGSC